MTKKITSSNPKNPAKKENEVTLRAFEYYYSLGENRSLKQVAKKFGRKVGSIEHWSSSLGWADRIRERDLQIASEIAGEGFAQALEVNKTILRIVKASIDARIVKDEETGEERVVALPVKNFSDAQKAHELQDRILHPERYSRIREEEDGGNKVAVVVNITKG